MLLNSDTVLTFPHGLALVPYTAAHVPRYHAWMQRADLLELTASLPLTLAEEHANMHSWRNDARKLTFILLLPPRMVGDVNLHLLDPEAEGFGAGDVVAEVEVMVAEVDARMCGVGKWSVRAIMAYARERLGVTVFVAKVLLGNAPSRALFEGAGFSEYRVVKAFGEVHMKLRVDEGVEETLAKVRASWQESSYKESELARLEFPLSRLPPSR